MHAFIIRPFGAKSSQDGKKQIDFDRVERELIGPALDKLNIGGRTTGEIIQAGNIRVDMFGRIASADIVVADISILNANVFYEIGARHALRDRITFLISCRADPVPFDVLTERYLAYDAEDPGASVTQLTNGLRASIAQIAAGGATDSPFFRYLPALEAQPVEAFQAVPADFLSELSIAVKNRNRGNLRLLQYELANLELPWASAGLLLVAERQFELKDFYNARRTWEVIAKYNSGNVLALRRLATIHQKLGELSKSDEAIERALQLECSAAERAELHGLAGSNHKTCWLRDWRDNPDLGQRRARALRSPFLQKSYDAYREGFLSDLNHYYPGLNAYSLLVIRETLADACPAVWEQLADDPPAALATLHKERAKLEATLSSSFDATQARLTADRSKDPWLAPSLADFACFSGASRIAVKYQAALADATAQTLDSVRRQLDVFKALEVRRAQVDAALEALDELEKTAGGHRPPAPDAATPLHRVVFTGHRVDAPGRATPRFPASAEGKARTMIRERLLAIRDRAGGNLLGLSGAASGGDILFHEICSELGIRSEVYLVAPAQDYVRESVADSGGDWSQRFYQLTKRLDTHELQPSLDLPAWLVGAKDYSVWQRSNVWIASHAIAQGAGDMTLLALWNYQGGDGPGGTQDMVDRIKNVGGVIDICDARKLLE